MTPDLLDHWTTAEFWLHEMPWLRLAAYLVLSTFVLGNVATYLRFRRGWRDGDTRKLSHFGHMVIAAPLLAFLPPVQLLPAVTIGTVAVVLIYAVGAASTHKMIHGIVAGSLRERDKPHARFFFFFPLIVGNLALVAAVFLFPIEMVRVAFFTAAIADGVAEPVGLRYGGDNKYKVPDLIWRSPNDKSVAGSLAVLFTATIIASVYFVVTTGLQLQHIIAVAVYGLAIAVLEALAPRGTDNMLLLFVGPVIMQAIVTAMP